MEIIDGIPVWGKALPDALTQIKNCRKEACGAALMADHHLGYAVPIGGVVAYEDQISPSGVGYDIGCGNKAVLLDIPSSEVTSNIRLIMDDIWNAISFGVGRKNSEVVEHEIFEHNSWANPGLSEYKELARSQIGTVGSGNHYVDIFIDEQSRIWCGVHFGSRGFGHKIATKFLELAGGKDGMMVDPVTLSVNSDLGQQYIEAMQLAGRYAHAGRDWVCQKVARLLGAQIVDQVHNHHNFAWKELHGGKEIWVVRKGATPAFPGQRGFIGATMAENAVIVEGVESEESKAAYYSTVHGAGRVMSRREAIGRFAKDASGKRQRKAGAVSHAEWTEWVKREGVELRGGGIDEAPQCYKRLSEVLSYHANTIKVLHTLKPLGVAMAGRDEFDPYRD